MNRFINYLVNSFSAGLFCIHHLAWKPKKKKKKEEVYLSFLCVKFAISWPSCHLWNHQEAEMLRQLHLYIQKSVCLCRVHETPFLQLQVPCPPAVPLINQFPRLFFLCLPRLRKQSCQTASWWNMTVTRIFPLVFMALVDIEELLSHL